MRTGVFGRRRSGVRKSQRGVVQGDAVRRGDLAGTFANGGVHMDDQDGGFEFGGEN